MMRCAPAVALAFVVASAGAPPCVRAQTSNEIWSRLDLTWNLSTRYRLLAIAQLRRHQDFGESQAVYGIHFDDMAVAHGFVRVGYRYLYTLNEPASPENRGLVEVTLHGVGATRFVNRVRFELRDLSEGLSARVRERVRVEHDTRIGRVSVLPYAMAEGVYDSRFGGLARVRSLAGAEVRLTGTLGADVAYLGQQTWRGEREYVNALYTRLMLTF